MSCTHLQHSHSPACTWKAHGVSLAHSVSFPNCLDHVVLRSSDGFRELQSKLSTCALTCLVGARIHNRLASNSHLITLCSHLRTVACFNTPARPARYMYGLDSSEKRWCRCKAIPHAEGAGKLPNLCLVQMCYTWITQYVLLLRQF